jgi:hypothetical protein
MKKKASTLLVEPGTIIRKMWERRQFRYPSVATSSFFSSISGADFMYVHCKINLESLSQASASRNKKTECLSLIQPILEQK